MKLKTTNKVDYLKDFITNERWDTFTEKIENRTKYITLILEDIFHEHNISACMRSADCFGIQDVHIIENSHIFKDNTEISMGASKWLTLTRHNNKKNNTIHTIHNLKTQGYQILAASPHNSNIDLFDNSLISGKTAILFGSELNGCSKEAIKLADKIVKIPMYGFTESFNISVAVALTLQQLIYKLRNSNIKWKLDDNEKNIVILNWLRNSIKSSEIIEKKYEKNNI